MRANFALQILRVRVSGVGVHEPADREAALYRQVGWVRVEQQRALLGYTQQGASWVTPFVGCIACFYIFKELS